MSVRTEWPRGGLGEESAKQRAQLGEGPEDRQEAGGCTGLRSGGGEVGGGGGQCWEQKGLGPGGREPLERDG